MDLALFHTELLFGTQLCNSGVGSCPRAQRRRPAEDTDAMSSDANMLAMKCRLQSTASTTDL